MHIFIFFLASPGNKKVLKSVHAKVKRRHFFSELKNERFASPFQKNPASSSEKNRGKTYEHFLAVLFPSTVFCVKKFTTKDLRG